MASPIVSFRCPQELKDEIEATAAANGLKPSEWLLGLVKRELAGENAETGPATETPREDDITPLVDDSTPVRQVLDSELDIDERIEQAIASRLESFQRNIAYTLEQYGDRVEALERRMGNESYPTQQTDKANSTGKKESPAANDSGQNHPPDKLTQSDLARRLGCSPSTLSNRRDHSDFPQWSQSKDPEGIAWHYRKWWFYPVASPGPTP